MKPRNTAHETIVPLCIGIVLLLLCSAGIGTVSAQEEVSLGDVYLNALYEHLGSLPIAGNENGWRNTVTGNTISFMKEDATHYYIQDGASSAATSNLEGMYEKGIGGTRYLMYVRYPTVPVSGYIYLNSDLSTPIGHLIGTTATTAYAIKLSVPATLGNCKVSGIALTNPDNSLTRIVGDNNGNTIEYTDSLAGYDIGVWTVTPVFQSGTANGFSNLAPSYMYGSPAEFAVKQADNSISLAVTKTSTPIPTRIPTPTPTIATPSPTPTPEMNDSEYSTHPNETTQDTTPAETQNQTTTTQESPAPLAGLIAGLGIAGIVSRLKRS